MTSMLLLLAACSATPDPAEPVPDPTTAPVTAEAPPQPELPRAKEFTAVDTSKLGTLPDGIGIAVGQPAPDAELTDFDGKPTTLGSLYAEGPVLLVFYRGGWCPFCNFQVRELVEGRKRFAELGVKPVLISVDQPSASTRTRDAWHIPYPVLSDPQLAAHEAWRVVHQVDDERFSWLADKGLDLEAASGQTHHKIAVPSIFLVDGGEVKWAHADPEYKVRPTNEQLFEVITQHLGGA